MIGDIRVEETVIISLNEDQDKERLASLANSLTKGKKYYVKLKNNSMLYYTDEEGIRQIVDEINKMFSGERKFLAERLFISNTFPVDTDVITFGDIFEMMSEAGLEQNGYVSVEVTEHILRITDLPY